MSKKLLTIDELAKKAKVPTRTIRFYNQEKLLPPPKEFKGRVALYGTEHLEKIKLIRTLKEKHFLPLALIREILESPENLTLLDDCLKVNEEVLAILKHQAPTISQKELSKISSIPAATIKKLQERGFLQAIESEEGDVYSIDNLQVATILKKFLDQGFTINEISFLPTALDSIAHDGVELIHEKYHGQLSCETEFLQTVERITRASEELLTLLYRQLLQKAVKEHLAKDHLDKMKEEDK